MVSPVEELIGGSPGHGIAAIKPLLRDDAGIDRRGAPLSHGPESCPRQYGIVLKRGEAGIIAGKGKVEVS